uniref:Peptidase S1 domain-containing protein n=1 Tax=Cacopsylla melanoneura TaxID=428564 RepID=A0A8D8S5L0_9HEMI
MRADCSQTLTFIPQDSSPPELTADSQHVRDRRYVYKQRVVAATVQTTANESTYQTHQGYKQRYNSTTATETTADDSIYQTRQGYKLRYNSTTSTQTTADDSIHLTHRGYKQRYSSTTTRETTADDFTSQTRLGYKQRYKPTTTHTIADDVDDSTHQPPQDQLRAISFLPRLPKDQVGQPNLECNGILIKKDFVITSQWCMKQFTPGKVLLTSDLVDHRTDVNDRSLNCYISRTVSQI